MKKLGFLIAGVSLLLSGALTASIRPCPGQFSFTLEWVYLEPIVDNPYYVFEDNEQIDADEIGGKRFANDMDYHSGFRVEGIYAFCDVACPTDFRFAWTHLDADHAVRKRNADEDLYPTVGHPEQLDGDTYEVARSKVDFEFQRVEGLFGLHILDCGCLSLVLEAGLQYADFDYENKMIFDDRDTGTRDIDRVVQDSKYWGIGPQFGFDLNYHICGGLSINGTVDWALLVGENETKFVEFDVEVDNALDYFAKNDCIWRIVPATHMRAGLNYGFGCGCWEANLEVGYQFYSYVRALDSIEFVDDEQEGRSLDIYSNADLHGPYVAFTFNF